MTKRKPGTRVREPVQVYLDRTDHDLLEQVARHTALPKTEVLRRGLRMLAEHVLTERAPGWSFESLVGVLGTDPELPRDLAMRHDEYLYRPADDRSRAR